MNTTTEPEGSEEPDPPYAEFVRAVNTYFDKLDAAGDYEREMLPFIVERTKERIADLKNFLESFRSEEVDGTHSLRIPASSIAEFELRSQHRSWARHPRMAAEGLLIHLFCATDAFYRDLLFYFYSRRPELATPKDGTIKYQELFELGSLEEAREKMVEDEVDACLRGGYRDLFDRLGQIFDVPVKYDAVPWDRFAEASLRRNVCVHCDGRVTRLYLKKIAEWGLKLPGTIPNINSRLKVSRGYVAAARLACQEIGIKLALMIHNKQFPDDNEKLADELLHGRTYRLLQQERWNEAIMFAEYHLEKAFKKQERDVKVATINLAQAYKWRGDDEMCVKTLDTVDWSDVGADIETALAILNENYDRAAEIIRRHSDNEFAFDVLERWPLSRKFREWPSFGKLYEECSGLPYKKSLEPEEPGPGEDDPPPPVQGKE